jgi:asparagine synthase (glutamine-hydrolysing)
MLLFGHIGTPAAGAAPDELRHYGPLAAAFNANAGSWGTALAGHSVAAEGTLSAVLAGNPIWLTDDAEVIKATSPAASVLAAYRLYGRGFLERLHGGFAVAVVDSEARRALLAIDRMGIERMTYHVHDDWLVFGASAEDVARCPGVQADLDRQALFDYLLLHMVPAPATVYTGVRKLRAGTCLVFERGRATIERYWQPKFHEYNGAPEPVLQARLLEALEAGVRTAAPGERSGAFLSGGLDSSSVAGMLARVRGSGARTFSIGFGVDAFDERAYARIAARHFGLNATEYDVTADDIVAAFTRIAGAYDEPFGNSSAVPTYFCAKVAKEHGIDHLLAGDGGDEIYGGNERYARHPVFEHYARVPAPIRKVLLDPLVRLPEDIGFMPLRKLRSYVEQARIPLPERLESWNFMYRIDLAQMLDPDLRAAIDPRAPLRSMKELWDSAPCETLLNKMLFFDWQYTLADNDLRKVGTMCALAGVRVSYPMLDPRVIDLSLCVPSAVKMRGNRLRTFYKDATRNFLPREILEKKKHGFGLPFGHWLKTHRALAELIYGLLSQLKSRRIVKAEFLDDLIEQHRGGHPSYYGYAIWDLAMLEAWLAARAQRVSRAA